MSEVKGIEKKLSEPFPVDDIEWRVQQAGFSANGKPYCMVIPYITNRAIQKRLDDVFGLFGWDNLYKPTPDNKGYLCGISVSIGDKKVTKWDGAEYTNIEALKGALSDSMKRAAVQFGIGRYLYQLDAEFAVCCEVERRSDAENLHVHYPNKKDRRTKRLISWQKPPLPEWAQPQKDHGKFLDAIKNSRSMVELKEAFTVAYKTSQVNGDQELEDKAIKAKEEIKAKFEKCRNEMIAKSISELSKWIDSECKIFSQLPTEATVESYSQKIKVGLDTQVSELNFDCSVVYERLTQHTKNRINQIKKDKGNGKQ